MPVACNTMGMLLHESIDHMAATDPRRPALVFHGRTLSFGELSARTKRVAAALGQCTGPGDRVAIIGENHPSWVEAYYGVPRAGRILAFLNHRLTAAELAAIVVRAGATAVVGPPAELDRIEPSLAALVTDRAMPTYLDLDQWEDMANEGAGAGGELDRWREEASSSADTPIWLIHTSGTTGSPKGATLTHRNVAASLVASAHGRPIGPDDVYMHPFPLCHVAGYNVVRNLGAGRPVVLMDRFEPDAFVSLVDRHQVTKTTMAATMLSSLMDHLDAHPAARPQLASLQAIAYGAAPMPPTLLRRAFTELQIDFSQGYGMTELAGNAVFLSVEEHRRALVGAGTGDSSTDHLLTAAGRPAPNVEVRLLDDADHEVSVGVPGEIVIRGEQVMAGYWRDPEATKAAFSEGWFHTGDIGVFDADGLLSVVDRKKDVIVTGAENVSSREVEEEILRSCPEVREVAVVAVADAHWGENVCAVIVLRAGATLAPEVLFGRVRERLAGFKAPRHVVEIDELPRNALGKPRKHELRRWLADQPAVIGPRL